MEKFDGKMWAMFSGAEMFEDGADPVFTEVGDDALVIIDGSGFWVHYFDEDDSVSESFFKNYAIASAEEGIRLFGFLPVHLSPEGLRFLGFVRI